MTYKPFILYPDVPVGPVLAQLRTAHSMTKGKMAQLMDVNPDTIARWEKTTSTIPLTQAIRYCNFLNIEVAIHNR